jgi:hypothetical protein
MLLVITLLSKNKEILRDVIQSKNFNKNSSKQWIVLF